MQLVAATNTQHTFQMSNLLRATTEPWMGWWYKRTPLDEDGLPANRIETGLGQPETIRIKFDIPEAGRNAAGRTREVSADIVPDKGIFGPEYALVHTFPDFATKIRARLDPTAEGFVSNLHNLLGLCFQGVAKLNGGR